MPSQPLRYEAVRRHVLDLVESGALAPGAKAPSLRGLAGRLGVSLSTVNQAYAALEDQGVLEARPRSGFVVCRAPVRPPVPEREPEPDVPPEPNRRARLVRQVLAGLGRMDSLHLGLACPAEDLLPTARLSRLLAQCLRREGGRAARYGDVLGHEPLRRQVVLRGLEIGVHVRPDETLITCGAMEALYVALRCVARPGDTVLVASPTYFSFLQLLETMGIRAVEVPSHPGEGVRPADLERALSRFRVAACVLTPNFNNPDGSLVPDEAKAEIVALMARHEVPLIEDDIYGDLCFGKVRPGVCKRFDAKGLVLTCSSFSKTVSPGYRVGWLWPGRYLERAHEIKSTLNVTSPTPTQMALAEYLESGQYPRHLARLRAALCDQMRLMRSLVGRHFPEGVRVSDPQGGVVLWVKLPGLADGVDFLYRAQERGLTVAPGTLFSPSGRFGDYVRLAASLPAGSAVEQTVRLLGEIAREMV
ncbi:PLP-dependent aminotransferase family protein [Fundidesulfovibrio butyratiphilus]